MVTKSKSIEARVSGISLPIVLIFLAVISLLATVGIRRSTVSEALSRNQMDHEIARQAAEAALRDGERDLLIKSGALQTGALCARGEDREGGLLLSPPNWDMTCPNGQCFFSRAYYAATNFDAPTAYTAPNPPVNTQPWWPNGSKYGQWNNDLSTKPTDAAGVGSNCTFVGAVPLGTFTGTPRLPGVVRQPEYLMEYIRVGTDYMFRVTARGFGSNAQAEVVLQSYINFD
jgi:type IV pilus assembly protein PilX